MDNCWIMTTCQDAREENVLEAGKVLSYYNHIVMAGKELDSMHPKYVSLDIDL
jgi:hypothetical protein